jgi:hypothetical protein
MEESKETRYADSNFFIAILLTQGCQAINEMTICPEISVKNGDVMYFTAIYDASKHPL